MKGKDEGRLVALIEKINAGAKLTRAERRQYRKLQAMDEGLGREWRHNGMQRVSKQKKRRA